MAIGSNIKGIGKAEYTVSYPFLRGVDFSAGQNSARDRLAYAENMYRSYDSDGGACIESIPGFRAVLNVPFKINGIFPQRSPGGERHLIIHAGTLLLRKTILDDHTLSASTNLATVKDGKSRAFAVGYDVYVLDGERIVRVSADGVASVIGGDNAYVPTLFYNGEPYEQRNYLTDAFCEKTVIPSPDIYSFGSHGIYYRITDVEKKLCAVTGTNDAFTAENITIPAYTTIEGQRYKVVEIDDTAFLAKTTMSTLTIGEGITKIGKQAFSDCTGLKTVYCPESISEIGDGAFQRCFLLNEIYLGASLMRFGQHVFTACSSLTKVYYSANIGDFTSIENYTCLGETPIYHYDGNFSLSLEIPLLTSGAKIDSVHIGDESYGFDEIYEGTTVRSVLVWVQDKRYIAGKTVTLSGTVSSDGVFDGNLPTEKTGAAAVCACTVCEIYDGRVFLSGNPSCPNTVFYSGITADGRADPTYFGIYNRFTDGLGSSAVISMLGVGDALAVFKAEDDGDGSIFYHTPLETSDGVIPKVYPVSYINSGICAVGNAISFYDDPVFLSRRGLVGIEKMSTNLERSISCRSHNVNAKLLTESLNDACLAKWCGYLVIGADVHIYLADSRATFRHESGSREYEWYFLNGIGSNKNTSNVYRYKSCEPGEFVLHPRPDERTVGEIHSVSVNGTLQYYSLEDGVKYAAYRTEEVPVQQLSPISALACIDEELLFFGTEDGRVCMFNNDMRGTPPPEIANAEDFDEEEYARDFGTEIHPYYYSFNGSAPRYVITSVTDNCGFPTLEKNTVKHSLTLKCAAKSGGKIICNVRTDRNGYTEDFSLPNAQVDFSYFDFSNLAFSSSDSFTVPLSENEKRWVEKEITVWSDEFRSPIGIYSAGYRFTVKGRIKNN